MSTRLPGLAAASRTSSARLSTCAGWNRALPPYARIRTGRPSSARFTNHSSRGPGQCGPWIAPARSSVVGSESPAASNSRSRATFRVPYVASPGATVGHSSGIGTG